MQISVWSRAEKAGFEEAKQRWGCPTAYEQAWIYVSQALRKGGWVCSDEGGWAAVARDYLGRGRHALVVPTATNVPTFLQNAIVSLLRADIRPEIVKHVPRDAALELVGRGGYEIFNPRGMLGDRFLEEYSEDNFPQVIVDLSDEQWMKEESECLSMMPEVPSGSEGSDFRYQLRRFCRRCLNSGVKVIHRDIRDVSRDDTEYLLENWLKSVRSRFLNTSRPRVADFQRCFRDPVEAVIRQITTHPEDGFGSVIFVAGRPRAHWAAARIAGSGFGIYSMVADTSIQNLSHYTLYTALVKLRDFSARTVNLGGSELDTLYYFKSRLIGREAKRGDAVRSLFELKLVRPDSLPLGT